MKKRILLSIISGLAAAAAFGPFDKGFVAWAVLVPFLFALEGAGTRRSFLLGWAWGFFFFLGTVYWVVHSMYFYGGVSLAAGTGVMLLLASYLAVFVGLFALGFKVTERSGPLVRLLFLPSLWVVLEYLRGALFTGFPWVLMGYSQVAYLPLIQIADITGVWGVSFWVVMMNAAAYLAWRGPARGRGRVHVAAAALLATILVLGYGVVRTDKVDREVAGWDRLMVGVVQGNIEQSLKWNPSLKLETVNLYRRLSTKAKEDGAEFIVFPETAMPFYLAYDREMRDLVSRIPVETGAYLLTGAPHYTYDRSAGGVNLLNSAYLIDPSGLVSGRYDKVHLVPFGEYVPLKRLLFFARKLTAGAGDFVPGKGTFPLEFINNGSREGIGVLICYEAIFPGMAASFMNNGASLLVNITNDAWFGRTSAPYQHFDKAILRAVENRVFLVRSANTGISALVDPVGRVISRTQLLSREVLVGEVGLKRGKTTFFSRHTLFFPCTNALFSAIIIFLSLKTRRFA